MHISPDPYTKYFAIDESKYPQIRDLAPDEILPLCQKDPLFPMLRLFGVSTITHAQADISYSVWENKYTTVKSGNALGKDFISACLGMCFLYSFPPDPLDAADSTVVLCTAPTERQIRSVMWGEIANRFNNALIPLEGKLMKQSLEIGPRHYMTGFATRENSTSGSAKFSGYHAKNLLVICSEAQGIADGIYDHIQGVIAGDNNKMIMIGNPTTNRGNFYMSFKQKTAKKFTLSCLDHPNVQSGESLIPGAVTKDWCDQRLADWGFDSAKYQIRVLGEFAKEGTRCLLSPSVVEGCFNSDSYLPGVKSLGIDVARYGEDDSVLVLGDGTFVTDIHKISVGMSMPDLADYIEKYLSSLHNDHYPDVIVVDETNIGGGLVDILDDREDLLGAELIPINMGRRSNYPTRYRDIRSEIWWRGAQLFKDGLISIPEDYDLLDELCGPEVIYTDTVGGDKIKIESKKDMRRRGIRSPDTADAMFLMLYGSYLLESEDQGDEYESEHDYYNDRATVDATLDPSTGHISIGSYL